MSFSPDYKNVALEQVYLTPLAVQQQLAKDFAQVGQALPENFTNKDLRPSEITAIVKEKIIEILEQGEQELLQLLYIIDIPEKDFFAILPHADFIDLLTERVILREAYKVYLRNKFGQER